MAHSLADLDITVTCRASSSFNLHLMVTPVFFLTIPKRNKTRHIAHEVCDMPHFSIFLYGLLKNKAFLMAWLLLFEIRSTA